MTVGNTNTPQNRYPGDGTTVLFTYDFPVTAAQDLEVLVRAEDGGESVLALDSDYTVTGAGTPTGGSVVLLSAPAIGSTLVLRRNVALTQETDYVENDPFPAAVHEAALDKLTLICQELREEIRRGVKFAKSSANRDIAMPEPVAGKFLRWNAEGAGLENMRVEDLSACAVSDLAKSLLDDAEYGDVLRTLQFSDLAVSLVQITGGTAYLQELGVTAFGLSLLDDNGQSEARTTLGLGTAATKNVGTAAGNVVEVQLYGALPALDAGALVNAAPRGWISGLQMANAADADHDITIATGVAADSAGGGVLTLASAITKQIDAAWAAGTNAGGLDTGTVAGNTWYSMWLIKKTDGTVDALFSTSATAPAMPSGYTLKRRVGSVKTDGSANIVGFVQNGDGFLWKDPPVDVYSNGTTTVTVTSSAALKTLSVPTGVTVNALLNAFFIGADSNIIEYVYLSCPSVNDEAPNATQAPLYTVAEPFSGGYGNNLNFYITTDFFSRIRARATGNGYLSIVTLGWRDDRGKE
jgi:hypothetical protein